MNPNNQFEAIMKARRKNMGVQQSQIKKPEPKNQQVKTQKKDDQSFQQKRKNLETLLFKQNMPKQQVQQKPKEAIKGNSESMKNAKAMLEAKLNFGGGNVPASNTKTNAFLPPPSLNLPNLPPPPSLSNLPLPPPPPILPNMKNLPPPPTLPNLPPPPPLSNNIILPPPPPLNIPQNNFLPPSIPSNLPPPPMNLPSQKTTTIPQQSSVISDVQSNRTSSRINESQFRNFQNNIKKQKSIDRKKSIFGNEPMIKSSNNTTNQSSSQQVNPSNSQAPIYKPIILPSSNQSNQPQHQAPQRDYTQKQNNRSVKPSDGNRDNERKKIFKNDQNSITSQFFGKDVAGFLKRQFLKSNDVLNYIDKKLPMQKFNQKQKYNFPSIFKGTRGEEGTYQPNFEPQQTLYIDIKTLNVSGAFLVNNLNTIKTHNDWRESFMAKLKNYDFAKDPQKLNFRVIKELVEGVPSIQYREPNLAKIYSCIRKCDALIKQKIATEDFDRCKQIKQMRSQLIKSIQKYCKYPEDYKDGIQAIERMMSRIKDLQFN